MEKEGRTVIKHQYDPQNHIRNIFTFRGTSLDYVLLSKNFWVLQIKHILIFIGWALCSDGVRNEVHEHWILKSGYVSALGSLVVFTIVFYAGNCYTAYKELFSLCVGARKELVFIAGHLKAILANSNEVWGCVRHLLAAQRVFYYDLQNEDHYHVARWQDWSTASLIKPDLLSKDEVDMIARVSTNRITLLTSWSEAAFLRISKQNAQFKALPPPCQSQYLGRFVNASAKLQQLLMSTVDVKEFGVPFIYHHIVHLLVNLYLVLLSISSVFIDEDVDVNYWALITYPVVCFVMLGILSSADAMADPFGDDDCDFNLTAATLGAFKDVRGLLDMIETDRALQEKELSRVITSLPPDKPPATALAPAPAASAPALGVEGRLEGLVAQVTQTLASKTQEQQALLQDSDQRMLALMEVVKTQLHQEPRRHERQRRGMSGCEGGEGVGGGGGARVKRREREGIEMTTRSYSRDVMPVPARSERVSSTASSLPLGESASSGPSDGFEIKVVDS